jgi:hypothetical protein
MTASRDRERPKWTDVVTAFSTIVGGGALFFAAYQYYDSRQQAKIDVAIRVIADQGPEIPYIPQHCLSAGNDLKVSGLTKLHNREHVPFASDAQAISVGKCLADLGKADREEVYDTDNGRPIALTPKGAALLAQRLNHALDKDEFISNLIIKQIGDKDLLLKEFGWRLCNLDKRLAHNLIKVAEEKGPLLSIELVANISCPRMTNSDSD